MTIRPFQPADLARVREIQMASPEASQWGVDGYQCIVIGESCVMGFLLSRQLAPDEHELLNIAVHPQARRQGHARQLLQHALKQSPGSWYLEVRKSNSAARRLYEAVGFQVCGHRPAYYHNPPETGIVMKFVS